MAGPDEAPTVRASGVDDPLYVRVARRIEREIRTGVLRAGDRAPSVRSLSRALGVSMTTVLEAYYRLEDRGYLEARPRSGFYACSPRAQALAEPACSSAEPSPSAVATGRLTIEVLRSFTDPGMVPLGAACPAPHLLPARKLNRIVREVLRERPPDDDLLTALMANIQGQAIPRWWNRGALRFRLKLLAIRGKNNVLKAMGLVFIVAALIACLYNHPFADVDVKKALENLSSFRPPTESRTLLGLLLGVFIPFIGVMRGLSTFGVSPGRLAALFTGSFRPSEIESPTALRLRFGSVYGEVTEALSPNRLVIFIDDLDRCQAPNVVRVLEMVNFLVSSGDCYVILGMAREWVSRAVGSDSRMSPPK